MSHISEAWGLGYPEIISASELPKKDDEECFKKRAEIDHNIPRKLFKKDLITFEDEHTITTSIENIPPDAILPV